MTLRHSNKLVDLVGFYPIGLKVVVFEKIS